MNNALVNTVIEIQSVGIEAVKENSFFKGKAALKSDGSDRPLFRISFPPERPFPK